MDLRILVVDDEESIRFTFKAFLEDVGYVVETAESIEEALELISGASYDAVFADILLGRDNGVVVLRECRDRQPNTPVIMMTGVPELKTATDAVRLGAFDYIAKPVHQDELLRLAKRAVEHKALVDRQECYQLRMAAVFQSICEGVLIFDEEMQLAEINQAAADILGCRGDMIGLRPDQLGERCPPLKLVQEALEERCAGEIFRLDTRNCTGKQLVLGLTMAPLQGQGARQLGTVLVLRDESLPVRQVEA